MIVLDASAAVEMALEGEKSENLRGLMYMGERCVAPDLFISEVANSFRKYVKAGLLPADEALRLTDKAIKLVDEFYSAKGLWREALRESIRLGHPTYDILYLVLARRNAATLYTLDRRLQDLCLKNGVDTSCELLDDHGDKRDVRVETENQSSCRSYTQEELEEFSGCR